MQQLRIQGALILGKVAISFKVMPSDETKDIDRIRDDLSKELSRDFVLGNSKVEELAFGIKVLKIIVIVDDKGGVADRAEERIRSFPGIGEVDVEEVSLIS